MVTFLLKKAINTIDGHNNGIPSHFAKMYTRLYNCVDDEDNLSRIEESIKGKITQHSNRDICQITAELLRTASQKFKSGKSASAKRDLRFLLECTSNSL